MLNNLGDALGVTRDPEGIGYLERSLAIRREIGDRMGEAQAANNLADAYQALGRTEEALELYRRALELNREVGYRYGEGVALVNLGSTLLDLDRAAEAVDLPAASPARIFAEIDYPEGAGYALHILGRCYLSLRRDAEALECLRQALASHQATGNRRRQAATLRSLGTAQSRAGLAAEAPRVAGPRRRPSSSELGDSAQAEEVRRRAGTNLAFPEIPVTIMAGRYDAARLPRTSFGGLRKREGNHGECSRGRGTAGRR